MWCCEVVVLTTNLILIFKIIIYSIKFLIKHTVDATTVSEDRFCPGGWLRVLMIEKSVETHSVFFRLFFDVFCILYFSCFSFVFIGVTFSSLLRDSQTSSLRDFQTCL